MGASTWVVTPNKFLRPDQVAQIRTHLESERASGDRYAIRNAAIVETLLGTGLRVSEACSLTIGDLFLDPGAANILVRRGKGGKTRLVAVADRLATYLKGSLSWKLNRAEPLDGSSPLFLSERWGFLTRSAAHRVWKAALAGAGLPTRWGVHATRHSYAVEIYRRTRDLRLTQRLLGHSNPTTTTVYANLLDDDVRKGVEQMWATP